MKSFCLCGAEFCMKCEKLCGKSHDWSKCLISDKNGKICAYFIIFCIYFWILFPFLPFWAVFLYRKNWNKNVLEVLNEHPCFYFVVLWIFSPMILAYGIVMFPFVAGWGCVNLLIEEKTKGTLWLFFKIILYVPSVLMCFVGMFLGLSLTILFLPLFPLTLIH